MALGENKTKTKPGGSLLIHVRKKETLQNQFSLRREYQTKTQKNDDISATTDQFANSNKITKRRMMRIITNIYAHSTTTLDPHSRPAFMDYRAEETVS